MPTIDTNPFTGIRNLNLKEGILRFADTFSSNPVSNDTAGYSLYINSSGSLVYWDGSTTTTLGAAGAVSNFSLNDAYDD